MSLESQPRQLQQVGGGGGSSTIDVLTTFRIYMYNYVYMYMYMYMFLMKEERKKQGQTNKQGKATQHVHLACLVSCSKIKACIHLVEKGYVHENLRFYPSNLIGNRVQLFDG